MLGVNQHGVKPIINCCSKIRRNSKILDSPNLSNWMPQMLKTVENQIPVDLGKILLRFVKYMSSLTIPEGFN